MCASKNATAGISNPRDGISWWTMNWRKKKSRFILKHVVCQLRLQTSHPGQNNAKWVKCKRDSPCSGQFLTMSGHYLRLTMCQSGLPPTRFCAGRYYPHFFFFLMHGGAWHAQGYQLVCYRDVTKSQVHLPLPTLLSIWLYPLLPT